MRNISRGSAHGLNTPHSDLTSKLLGAPTDWKVAMARTRYFLDPNPKGGWDLKKQGSKRATKHFDKKADGLTFSRSFVRQKKDSQLIVKKRSGVIQTEHTYGHDPKRYPG